MTTMRNRKGQFEDNRNYSPCKVCVTCSNMYSKRRNKSKLHWSLSRFCSRVCYFNYIKGENHWNWKGGVCQQSDGYILISSPNHPAASQKDGYVMEHRLIVEKSIGRYLRKDEIVHHINGNRKDNRIDNLEITNQVDHGRYHANKMWTARLAD